MSKSYVIHWKSKVNGRAGRGTTLFDREAAERLVVELNRDYPEIEHEAKEDGHPEANGVLVALGQVDSP